MSSPKSCEGCGTPRGDLQENHPLCPACDPNTPETKRFQEIRRLRNQVDQTIEHALQWQSRFEALASSRPQEEVDAAFNVILTDEKRQFLHFLDPTSRNFLGSGLSCQEWLMRGYMDRVKNCFSVQNREEQNRRLNLVLRMAKTLETTRNESQFACALGEIVIKDLIAGQLEPYWTETLRFTADLEDAQKTNNAAALQYFQEVRSRWEPFVALVHEALGPSVRPPELNTPPDAERMMADGGWQKYDTGWILGDAKPWTPEFHFDRCFIDAKVLALLYEAGVRWRGEEHGEPGYWLMHDRGLFPEPPNTHERVYRFYEVNALLQWFRRNHPQGF